MSAYKCFVLRYADKYGWKNVVNHLPINMSRINRIKSNKLLRSKLYGYRVQYWRRLMSYIGSKNMTVSDISVALKIPFYKAYKIVKITKCDCCVEYWDTFKWGGQIIPKNVMKSYAKNHTVNEIKKYFKLPTRCSQIRKDLVMNAVDFKTGKIY